MKFQEVNQVYIYMYIYIYICKIFRHSIFQQNIYGIFLYNKMIHNFQQETVIPLEKSIYVILRELSDKLFIKSLKHYLHNNFRDMKLQGLKI